MPTDPMSAPTDPMSTESADPLQAPTRDIRVIVTAYNEAPRIGATLDALAVAFPGAPIWVADDGSTDATSLVAREAGARVVRSERMIGKGAAATLAAREALEDARSAWNACARTHTHKRARVPSQKSNVIHDERIFILCD